MRVVRGLFGLAIAAGMTAIAAPAWAPTAVEYSLLLPAVNQGRPIEISSFQWGVGRGLRSDFAEGPQAEGRPPAGTHELIIVVANPDVLRGLAGRRFDRGVLFIRKAGAPPAEYDLTGVTTASLSGGGDRPSESLSLNFTKIEMRNAGMGDGSVRPAEGGANSGNPWAAP